jgi:hypothetical protein
MTAVDSKPYRPLFHVVVWFDLYPLPSGQDEDTGRAIVATLAWETACEALGHADAVAEMQPSELALARADAAREEVHRAREVFNEALAEIGLGRFPALPISGGVCRSRR